MAFLLQVDLGLYLIGAAAGLLLPRANGSASRASHAVAVLAGALGALTATAALAGHAALTICLPVQLPLSSGRLEVEGLSAFFLLVISLGSLTAALYAPAYLRNETGRRSTGLMAALFNLFVLTMILVVTAADAVVFLIAWEGMSLLSYLLVVTEHEEAHVRRAGFIYLAMTHAGTAAITAGFLILSATAGTFEFSGLTAAAPSLSPRLYAAAILLFTAGFGAKAGLVPLHIWLPEAHPSAPSHVSALMSGVMVKTAIYGLLRFVTGLAGTEPAWTGSLLLAVGLASALLGVLYALVETDLKRLLAFSTIENVGVIVGVLGAAMLAESAGLGAMAFALRAAALLHTLNHAIFKGLLFQSAGAVLHATHSRNLEEMGGLARRMPVTALMFLGGALAISALPPLNGFASEWLMLTRLAGLAFAPGSPWLGLAGLAAATLLALTGALVAAAFLRAFGVSFLGLPRGEASSRASEAPRGMLAAMALNLALVVGLGLFPAPILRLTEGALSGGALSGGALGGGALTQAANRALAAPAFAVPALPGGTPLAIALTLLTLASLAFLVTWLGSGRRRVRVSAPWACGVELQPEMQYSGGALATPFRTFFSHLLRPRGEVLLDPAAAGRSPYFPETIRYHASLSPVYERYLYRPARLLLVRVSAVVRLIQTGSVQAYLGYILVTLVLLTVLAR